MPRVTQKLWEELVAREISPATAAGRLGCSEVYAASEMDRVRKIVRERAARAEADRQLKTTWNYRG
ncbi:MAG: hypothetical protein ABIY70_08675 [Capsulimonas sp.]|uniref:hypothetical protein n=1 Tax=Capsulimonas sp. TaxID=2494211 RepID=UPI003263F5B7